MREETLPASWEIPFPEDCQIADIPGILNGRRLYEWHWDHFIWDLPTLFSLLDERPAVFDYLFVACFLTARASHLLMTGPFKSSLPEVWEGIARHKLQYAAVYRHLLMEKLHGAPGERSGGPVSSRLEGRNFLTKILEVESEYLRVIESICLMPDAAGDFAGYPLSCWVQGELCKDSGCQNLMPAAVPVPVRVESHPAFRVLSPGKAELAGLIRQNRETRSFKEFGERITSTDRDLRRMCQLEGEYSIGVIAYGEHRIGYYRAIVGADKGELRVVCGDRTLVIIRRLGGKDPGTYPTRIYPGTPTENENSHMYLVEFDNGLADHFWIKIRAHSTDEVQVVPSRVMRPRLTDSGRRALPAPRQTAKQRAWRELCEQRHGRGDGAGGVATATRRDALKQKVSSREIRETARAEERKPEIPSGAAKKVEREVVIGEGYRTITIDGHVIAFGKKYKRRQFLEFLHKRKQRTGEAEFCYDHAKEDYAKETGRDLNSERFDDDLFKGQPKEFRLLFKTVNKKKRIYRLLI